MTSSSFETPMPPSERLPAGRKRFRQTPSGCWTTISSSRTCCEVKRDLPAGYYQELPRLTIGPLAGYPRILALALGLIAHSDSSLNETQLRELVRAYQSVRQLTIGELWAIPIMLRLSLLENLRRLSQQMIATRDDREYATRWVTGQIADVRAGQPARAGAAAPMPRSWESCKDCATMARTRNRSSPGSKSGSPGTS